MEVKDVSSQTPAAKPRISMKELRILVDAIEANPSLYNAGNSNIISFMNLDKWMDLTERLNTSLGGAQLVTVSNWKYVLRFWCENTKIKLAPDSDEPKINAALDPEEAEELYELEKRLYAFMEREETKETSDEHGANDEDEGPHGDDFKFVVQMQDACNSDDENTAPGKKPKKKRTITLREGDFSDLARLTKKFKVIYDENLQEGEPQAHILTNQLDRLQEVSRKLEGHISSIQNRIHMIKDMWKHRCGDN